MKPGNWVIRVHPSPIHMYYTGESSFTGQSAWSFDEAAAQTFDTEADAEREARTLARWLNSEHRAVVQSGAKRCTMARDRAVVL